MAATPSQPDDFDSVHDAYQSLGPSEYYRQHGAEYRNPHEPIIRALISEIIPKWNLDLSNVLDLAAGSGEVTLAIRDRAINITAIDPYTSQAYKERTGLDCEPFTFEQIAEGAFRDRNYSTLFCSFAMHLIEESRLPTLCWELSLIAETLVILTPHKRPIIDEKWGWIQKGELLRQRVRARIYLKS